VDVLKKYGNLPVMLCHSSGKLLLGGQNLAKPNKGTHDTDIDLNGSLAAEPAREPWQRLLG